MILVRNLGWWAVSGARSAGCVCGAGSQTAASVPLAVRPCCTAAKAPLHTQLCYLESHISSTCSAVASALCMQLSRGYPDTAVLRRPGRCHRGIEARRYSNCALNPNSRPMPPCLLTHCAIGGSSSGPNGRSEHGQTGHTGGGSLSGSLMSAVRSQPPCAKSTANAFGGKLTAICVCESHTAAGQCAGGRAISQRRPQRRERAVAAAERGGRGAGCTV